MLLLTLLLLCHASPSGSLVHPSVLGDAAVEYDRMGRSKELWGLHIQPPAAAFRGEHPIRGTLPVHPVWRQAMERELPAGQLSRDIGMTCCFKNIHKESKLTPGRDEDQCFRFIDLTPSNDEVES